MSRDDFWFPWKGAKWLGGTRMLSPEARGIYADYITLMREGDGTLPDERTPRGEKWHCRCLGLRDARTLRRIVDELFENEKLQRLEDGRLTNPTVQRDIAKGRGGGDRGSGGSDTGGGDAGGGGAGGQPSLPLLRAIKGGKHAQPSLENLVEDPGTERETGNSRSTVDRQSLDSRPSRWKLLNLFKGRSDSEENSKAYSEFVAALLAPPRARGDPWLIRA